MKLFPKIEEGFQSLTIFSESSLLEVWLDSEYVFVLTRKFWKTRWIFAAFVKKRFLVALFQLTKKSYCTRLELTFTLWFPDYKGTPCSKQAWYLKFKWLQRDPSAQAPCWWTNIQLLSQKLPWVDELLAFIFRSK